MDLTSPFKSLFPTVDSSVLGVLLGSTKPRTGREVAREAHRSQRATKLVLDRLVDHGLVFREELGRSQVYTLNRNHIAAGPLAQLVSLRLALFDRLRAAVGAWRLQPGHVSVFGSAARGDGGLKSDIDIFVVRPNGVEEDDEGWREQVEALAEAVFDWTGNHAGIAEVGDEELGRLRREQPAILESLRADAVHIAGPPIRELLSRV
ncbi:MAG TPA: nucleotidyltransferase domain-containing protein [Solirubrobacterales bacterium]|nr:nucleotidyltransferase domain-containing protein [Solirubrobacterales bacterium]